MSREIKFRAWDKTAKYMDYIVRTYVSDTSSIHEALDNYSDDVLMQYSGLEDKSGVPIYEGDVVEWQGKRAEIKFRGGAFIADWNESMTNKILYVWGIDDTKIEPEVIGNVWENPELLGATNDI